MSGNLDTAANTHIYKPNRWILALNVFSLVFIGIVMGIPLIAFVLMLASVIRAGSKLNTFTAFLACLLSPLIVLLGFVLIQQLLNIILSFFSYLAFARKSHLSNRNNGLRPR